MDCHRHPGAAEGVHRLHRAAEAEVQCRLHRRAAAVAARFRLHHRAVAAEVRCHRHHRVGAVADCRRCHPAEGAVEHRRHRAAAVVVHLPRAVGEAG